jgi:hypothetical protein
VDLEIFLAASKKINIITALIPYGENHTMILKATCFIAHNATSLK